MYFEILSWRAEQHWFATIRRRRGRIYRRPYVALFSELGNSYVLGTAPVFATVDNEGEQHLADEERRDHVATMLRHLIAKHRHVIHERFWNELTLGEIGNTFPIPVSKEVVRQRIVNALRKCEQYMHLHTRELWEEYK